jgi:hypothetical protein
MTPNRSARGGKLSGPVVAQINVNFGKSSRIERAAGLSDNDIQG